MLREKNMDEFVNDLASALPAPGGGSAAGLAGSMGASLTSMVYNLTIGNKSAENLSPEVIQKMMKARDDMMRIKTEFVELVEEDNSSFTEFMDALKLPKGTEEEKAARKAILDVSKKKIVAAPEKIARLGDSIWDAIELANDYGNPGVISDAGVAALMTDAAIRAALLNVKVNLPMVKDEARRAELIQLIDECMARSVEKSNAIFNSVSKKLDA